MSNDDITLTAGDAEVTVQPGNGGRIGGLRVGGVELLRQGERVRLLPDGSVVRPDPGRPVPRRRRPVHQLPLNSPPHAIHGTARDGAWRTARATADEAVITYDLVEPWPLPGPGHPGRRTRRGRADR